MTEAAVDPFDPNTCLLPEHLNVPVRVYFPDAETFTLVSPEDAPAAFLLRWHCHSPGKSSIGNGHGSAGNKLYARASIRVNGKSHDIYLHRFLFAVNDGMLIDHIDGDGLNNTRENLREVTHSENSRSRTCNE